MGTRSSGAGRGGLNGAETRPARSQLLRLNDAARALIARGVDVNLSRLDATDPMQMRLAANALERFTQTFDEAALKNPGLILPEEIRMLYQQEPADGLRWGSIPAAEQYTDDAYRLYLNAGERLNSNVGAQMFGQSDFGGPSAWDDDPRAYMEYLQKLDKLESDISGYENPKFTSYDPRQTLLHEINHGQADVLLKTDGRGGIADTYGYRNWAADVDAHGIPNLGRSGWQPASTAQWGDVALGLAGNDHGISRYAQTTPAEFVAEIGAGIMLGRHYEAATLGWYTYLGGQKWKAVD